MELKWIVYLTINQCNGKFYIGVHETNPDVWDNYIGDGIYKQSDAKKDFPFHKAVRKYGYNNFKRTTLVIYPGTEEGKKQAFALETTLVNKDLLKSKQCYNVALGGHGGVNPDLLKRIYVFDLNGNYLRSFEKARDVAKFINSNATGDEEYNIIKAIRNNCLGTSSSCHGYYMSYKKEFQYNNQCITPVAQYTLSGKFLRYFKSVIAAEEELHISNIWQAINKKGSSGGFQWRYYNGDQSDISTLINVKTKNTQLPIKMINKESLEEKLYNSVSDCIKENPNLSASQINRVLKKIIKSHKGFIFKYQDEDIV